MIFKIPRKGYTEDRQIYKNGTIEINSGVTVLIGCNGSGKTTLLHEIESSLNKQHISVYKYNNLSDSLKNSMNSLLYNGDYDTLATLTYASEGESISISLNKQTDNIINIIKTGRKKASKLEEVFRSMTNYDEPEIDNSQVWLLFDAIDSGLSIDQVNDIKEYLFKPIIDNTKDKDVYIVVSANEYELCEGLPCFNVTDGKYVDINSYGDYKKQIMKTREYKDKQIAKAYTKGDSK